MHQNLREQVQTRLGRQIIRGELPSGEVLPNEGLLSDSFGVSRTVMREALKSLESKRLVVSKSRVGITVQPRQSWQLLDADVLSWSLEVPDNIPFLRDFVELRLMLEPRGAELCAERATQAQLLELERDFERLEQAIERAASSQDTKAWALADTRFHTTLLRGANNVLVTSLAQAMLLAQEKLRFTALGALAQVPAEAVYPYESPNEESLTRHRAIKDAILARDGASARSQMYDQLKRVQQVLEHVQRTYT